MKKSLIKHLTIFEIINYKKKRKTNFIITVRKGHVGTSSKKSASAARSFSSPPTQHSPLVDVIIVGYLLSLLIEFEFQRVIP